MVQTKLGASKGKNREIAEELALKQQTISVSEFFEKNRHLLGFDSPRKALLMAVKEAVDNGIDACEETEILPEIKVTLEQTRSDRFRVTVEDNGPGIIKEQLPKIFGKLLYGSKFHTYKQGRGQQGIGISATLLYGQLTTGKAGRITSKIKSKKQATYIELHLNTKTNEPELVKEELVDWEDKKHGTKISIEMEGKYQKGKQSVDEYIKQTAIANPHVTLIYTAPDKQVYEFPRAVKEKPLQAKEIKPHPYGIELGILIRMLKETKARTLQQFLQSEFSRVSAKVAKNICEKAKLYEKSRPTRIATQEADNLLTAIKETKIIAPPTDCLSPIREELIIKSLQKEFDAEFYAAATRPPGVYRGRPFQIEAGIAYGGTIPGDSLIKLVRFANKVPLLYQQSACAMTKSVIQTAWKNYGISQSKGALPSGPMVLMINIASVWVPFTSESKEALASYPEIIKEIKLALQECGRKLAGYVRKVKKGEHEAKRKKIFELYIEEVVDSLYDITNHPKTELKEALLKIAKKRTTGEEK